MNLKALISVSKVSGVCLALSIAAWLIAQKLATPTALEPWRAVWQVIGVIGIIGTVAPLALVHASLAAWANESIERLDRMLGKADGKH